MQLIQFSSAQGPLECAIAIEKASKVFMRELENNNISYEILEIIPHKIGYKSLQLGLDIDELPPYIKDWLGTHLWVAESTVRPNHKRKNWYFGVEHFVSTQTIPESEIEFKAIKAQGPGGQHVNKSSTAIQATHKATGISVKIQSERSQKMNKNLAILLIEEKLQNLNKEAENALKSSQRLSHHHLERGNPVKTFKGEKFIEYS